MKQVGLPLYYFRKTAKREYRNWQQAIPREFLQNSADAGAREFRINTQETDNYFVLSVKDNGCGMSVQDCEDKLLTMGGSGKGEDAVGGFGVAKSLLFFAWEKWEIRSRDYVVHGEGCQYNIVGDQPYVVGVHATIYIDNKEFFSLETIRSYLARCETNLNIYINDEPFLLKKHKGKRHKNLEWATLYKAKTVNKAPVRSSYMSIRIKGMHMFEVYVDQMLDCQLTLELHGNTRELLTSNRDGLRDPYSNQLHALVNDITVNILSSMEEKDEVTIQKFAGQGLEDGFEKTEIEKTAITDDIPNIFDDLVLTIRTVQTVAGETIPVNPVQHDAVYEEQTEQHRLDFPDIIVRCVDRKLPAKFNPKLWPYKVKTLMRLWLLVVKQVLVDNELKCRFGIGITLDNHHYAEFHTDEETPYFLLNLEQWRHGKKSKTDKPLLPKLSGKGAWHVVQELRQRAAHEVGHFVTGKDHNERFVAKVHEIEAKTWANETTYRGFPKQISRKKTKKAIDDNR